MANGIKLRRGLQTALAGTIADGELIMTTDTGKIGLKKGTTEHFIDLPTLATAVDNLQPVVVPGLIEVEYNKDIYKSNDTQIPNIIRVPLAKLNPLFVMPNDVSEFLQLTNSSLALTILCSDAASWYLYDRYTRTIGSSNDSPCITTIVVYDYGYGIGVKALDTAIDISGGIVGVRSLALYYNQVTGIIYIDINIQAYSPDNIVSILAYIKCSFISRTIKVNNQDIFVFLPSPTSEVSFITGG